MPAACVFSSVLRVPSPSLFGPCSGYGNGHSYIHIPANGSTAAGQGKASTRSIPLISQDSSRPFSMTRGYSSVYEA